MLAEFELPTTHPTQPNLMVIRSRCPFSLMELLSKTPEANLIFVNIETRLGTLEIVLLLFFLLLLILTRRSNCSPITRIDPFSLTLKLSERAFTVEGGHSGH